MQHKTMTSLSEMILSHFKALTLTKAGNSVWELAYFSILSLVAHWVTDTSSQSSVTHRETWSTCVCKAHPLGLTALKMSNDRFGRFFFGSKGSLSPSQRPGRIQQRPDPGLATTWCFETVTLHYLFTPDICLGRGDRVQFLFWPSRPPVGSVFSPI